MYKSSWVPQRELQWGEDSAQTESWATGDRCGGREATDIAVVFA